MTFGSDAEREKSAYVDRLHDSGFSPSEEKAIIGNGSDVHPDASTAIFNLLAKRLVEDLGLHEDEVSEWFRGEAKALDGKTPLEVFVADPIGGIYKIWPVIRDSIGQVEIDLATDDRKYS